MTKIKDAFKEISDSRTRIINTMKERGLIELNMIMTREEFAKENGLDTDDEEQEHEIDCNYTDYRNQEAPYIIYMDKYENGVQYDVLSVKMENDRLKFECVGEYDNDWFYDDDVVYLTRFNVYERMEQLLNIENEQEKIWLLTQESNVDGELLFNVVVCKDEETAKRLLTEEVKTILTESPKYKDAQRWMDGDDTLDYDDCPYSWENENDDAFYISCVYDDYYELIKIEEKEIQY